MLDRKITRRLFAVDPARRSLRVIVFVLAVMLLAFVAGYIRGWL